MDILFTTYFTKDLSFSQHDSSGGCKPNKYRLMERWYKSVWSNQIDSIVFHNELSNGFIRKYETKCIKFSKWGEENRPSYNDERFYCFLNYLKEHENIKRVFCTDIFDVEILRNPFELITDEYDLYLGSECNPSRGWIKKKGKEISLPQPDIDSGEIYYNAGIIGGKRENIIKLFELMLFEFNNIPKEINANIPVYNYCLHKVFNGNYFTGHPLHNVFKSNKVTEGVYIKHK